MEIERFHLRFVYAALVAVSVAPWRSLAAAAEESSPPAGDAAATVAGKPDEDADPWPVPPGSPADQALWKQAGEVSVQIAAARIASNAMQWRIRSLDLAARLASAAKAASGEEARRLEALRERLVAAQVENYQILTAQWPVDPTRGCQYSQLMLGSALRVAEGPDKWVSLAEARTDARRCVGLAQLAVGRLSRSNDALSPAVEESIKALPWPSSPAASPPPGAAGAAAAATGAAPSLAPAAGARKE